MQTRSGLLLSRRSPSEYGGAVAGKRARAPTINFFDNLPDDLLLLTFSKVSVTASCPSDIISILLTCKRFRALAMHPRVLSRVSEKGVSVRASRWSESAHRFLKICADAGSPEASYALGMIHFYCLESRGSGASLLVRAASAGLHPAALYSLAVMQFNGSEGGSRNGKDLSAGVALCARSACLGNVDALRELGHCLHDGYGVGRNVAEGRRFLIHANARELGKGLLGREAAAAAAEGRGMNRFMVEWFDGRKEGREKEGLRMCSHGGCGRPETRRHEFRRCSVCGIVNYCSRACQAMHWKVEHKLQCAPMQRWIDAAGADAGLEQGRRGM